MQQQHKNPYLSLNIRVVRLIMVVFTVIETIISANRENYVSVNDNLKRKLKFCVLLNTLSSFTMDRLTLCKMDNQALEYTKTKDIYYPIPACLCLVAKREYSQDFKRKIIKDDTRLIWYRYYDAKFKKSYNVKYDHALAVIVFYQHN